MPDIELIILVEKYAQRLLFKRDKKKSNGNGEGVWSTYQKCFHSYIHRPHKHDGWPKSMVLKKKSYLSFKKYKKWLKRAENEEQELYPEIESTRNRFQWALHTIMWKDQEPIRSSVEFVLRWTRRASSPAIVWPRVLSRHQLNQRGCGKSTGVTKPAHDLVNVENPYSTRVKWLVFGGSWGTTLALHYTVRIVGASSGLMLRGIFLGRQSDVGGYTKDGASFYPENFSSAGELVNAYYKRLTSREMNRFA